MFFNISLFTLVFDSWSKIPPGLLRGNRWWMGAADQCTRIKTAKYCVANMDLKGLFGGDKASGMVASSVWSLLIYFDFDLSLKCKFFIQMSEIN